MRRVTFYSGDVQVLRNNYANMLSYYSNYYFFFLEALFVISSYNFIRNVSFIFTKVPRTSQMFLDWLKYLIEYKHLAGIKSIKILILLFLLFIMLCCIFIRNECE